MIKPTVGRVVWYRPYIKPGRLSVLRTEAEFSDCDNGLPHLPGEPLPAIVAAVWNGNGTVNLTVFDINGQSHGRQGVFLWQGEEVSGRPLGMRYCEWMPYQKGQAAKTEALEKQIGHGG
jgi:hypothetical protein